MLRQLLFFTVTLAVFLAVLPMAGQSVRAQDLQPRDLLGKILETPSTPQEPQKPPQPRAEPTPIEEYPEPYLTEMNGFFEYCIEDTYLSRNHDCECMALEYIDKRMELGDAAASADIISAIGGTCLAREGIGEAGAQPGGEVELSDEQLEDIQQFYNSCTGNYHLSSSYDCDCLAARYTEKKLAQGGEFLSRQEILLQINNTCPNVEGSAGKMFQKCMVLGAPYGYNGSDDDYCECFANNFAKLYEEYGGGTDSSAMIRLQSHARLQCRRPL